MGKLSTSPEVQVKLISDQDKPAPTIASMPNEVLTMILSYALPDEVEVTMTLTEAHIKAFRDRPAHNHPPNSVPTLLRWSSKGMPGLLFVSKQFHNVATPLVLLRLRGYVDLEHMAKSRRYQYFGMMWEAVMPEWLEMKMGILRRRY